MADSGEGGRESLSSTPSGLLQSVDRALQILIRTGSHPDGWSVTEAAHELDLSISVAHRLLATLAHRGFLTSDPGTRRYRIGPSAMTVGRIWSSSQSLELLAQPILEELAEQSGLATILAVPDAVHMRAIAAHDGAEGPLRTYPLVGELFPAHAGATSKAYFAHLPAELRRRTFERRPMARFTSATMVDPEDLEADFARIRRQGYAYTVGEYDPHTATAAVLVSLRGEPFGSLSLGGWEDRMPAISRLIPLLEQARQQLERLLEGARGRARPPQRRSAQSDGS